MEKELEGKSSNVDIKTKLIKQENQRSGCLLLTLKQKYQTMLPNARASWFWTITTMEGKAQSRACVLGMERTKEEEEDACSLPMLSNTSPSVLDRNDSDIAILVSVHGLNRQ